MNHAETVRETVLLIRAARAGTLATSDHGQPFASLVTPAPAADGSLLMLLSGLSPHTRHLAEDARCSILLAGEAPEPNPQTAPRVTLVGSAQPDPAGTSKARWLAVHPYAGFYAGLEDFRIWRFSARNAAFVGGFARAHRFDGADLAPDPDAVAAVLAAEQSIMDHCNNDHAEALTAIAVAHGGAGEGWRMVTCDVDGCDLAQGEAVQRIAWPAPASTPGDVRTALVALATAARNPVAPGT